MVKKITKEQAINYLIAFAIASLLSVAFIIVGTGISKIISADNIVKPSQIQDNKPVILNKTSYSFPDSPNSLFSFVYVDFKTLDVFAVTNPINYTIIAEMKEPEKISQIYLVDLPISKQSSITKMTDLTDFVEKSNNTGHLVVMSEFLSHSWIKNDTFIPTDEEEKSFLLIAMGRSSGAEPLLLSDTKLTIYPATVYLQTKTNRDMRDQMAQSDKTNEIILGLTWITVSSIPFGFAYEIYRSKFG